MNLAASDIILFLLGVIVAGMGYWLKTIADDLKSAIREVAAHKLYASENYIKDNDLQKLRQELVGHFERLERLVNSALSQRRHDDRAGE